jgi:hypothetical protein
LFLRFHPTLSFSCCTSHADDTWYVGEGKCIHLIILFAEEIVVGLTLNGAAALNRANVIGRLGFIDRGVRGEDER